ncbi:MAG: hypothetical protein Q8Q67_04045 [bacterium]|nr:hypothetical protein [bacterium]
MPTLVGGIELVGSEIRVETEDETSNRASDDMPGGISDANPGQVSHVKRGERDNSPMATRSIINKLWRVIWFIGIINKKLEYLI